MCNDVKIKIVDEIMGAGKSSAAINYINSSSADERFLVITPYLDEVQRYKESCSVKKFKEPYQKRGSKLKGIKELISNGENIVSTHALFQKFDEEIIELCRTLNYTLIMDEVAEVVQEYDISARDIKVLLNEFCDLQDDGKLIWRDDQQDYKGKFEDIKNLCNLGGLAIVRERALMWLFPVEVFKAFNNIYILTYMFNAQIQRYYYDYYGVNYKYIHVGLINGLYEFIDKSPVHSLPDYHKLINIFDYDIMNAIGDAKTSLSKSWYIKYNESALLTQLKKNTTNFFCNIRKCGTKDTIWTTFKDYKSKISGKGYTKGFVPLNMRATNSYRDRCSLAYLVNIFLNPIVKGFFQDHGVTVDEDGYALSEMLQWIWRSAIRDGKEIWIYIPSRRMRELLIAWINEVSTIVN